MKNESTLNVGSFLIPSSCITRVDWKVAYISKCVQWKIFIISSIFSLFPLHRIQKQMHCPFASFFSLFLALFVLHCLLFIWIRSTGMHDMINCSFWRNVLNSSLLLLLFFSLTFPSISREKQMMMVKDRYEMNTIVFNCEMFLDSHPIEGLCRVDWFWSINFVKSNAQRPTTKWPKVSDNTHTRALRMIKEQKSIEFPCAAIFSALFSVVCPTS